MAADVDLLRNLLFRLEERQISPRSTVCIVTGEEAKILGATTGLVVQCLNLLQELGYIEGPGAEGSEIWLFRKLTSKGVKFVEAARDQTDWEDIKKWHAISG